MRSRTPQRKQMLVGLTSMKHLKPILAVGGFVKSKIAGQARGSTSFRPGTVPCPGAKGADDER
ncbi:hypothetical protein CBM2589_B130037 [Cupriavidus taiwanensis]|uniref:Uncharacterized protein n=1 Tax=Cupriavidus taiwanensis TaxID=164546 RepID=A0A975WVK0_9BURK|nr:hypothetical protein CBM2589_B130037 [Cupriavidus taiwanensis]